MKSKSNTSDGNLASKLQYAVSVKYTSFKYIVQKTSVLLFHVLFSKCVCLVTQLCLTLSNPWDCSPPGPSAHGVFQARVGYHFLLQGIFLNQGWSQHLLCLLHWRQILHPLSHQGIPFRSLLYVYHRGSSPWKLTIACFSQAELHVPSLESYHLRSQFPQIS